MADTWYLVKKGDTLSGIAQEQKVSVKRIERANPWIINPNYIRAGMTILIPSKTQNPRVNELYGGIDDDGNGKVSLKVEFELPKPAGADGWIVQQIDRSYDVRKPDGSVANASFQGARQTYWEAWPVKEGKTKTANRDDPTDEGVTYDDSFDQPDRTGTKGSFTVHAVVKFFELPGLPFYFVKNNPATRGMDLPSSIFKPYFWDGGGTIRDFEVDWDATGEGRNPSQVTNFVRRLND
jgi:hypothetical protein